jgi:hypothetical protein
MSIKWPRANSSAILVRIVGGVLTALILYLLSFVPRLAPYLGYDVSLPVWLLLAAIVILAEAGISSSYARLRVRNKVEDPELSARALTACGLSLPDVPFYKALCDQVLRIDSAYRKVKIPSAFLAWPHFTIIFWENVTEEFFRSHNNKYLFSYTTNDNDSSGPRRSAEVTHFCSFKVTHTRNTCLPKAIDQTGSIIHAGGVRVAFPSSAPEACKVLPCGEMSLRR